MGDGGAKALAMALRCNSRAAALTITCPNNITHVGSMALLSAVGRRAVYLVNECMHDSEHSGHAFVDGGSESNKGHIDRRRSDVTTLITRRFATLNGNARWSFVPLAREVQALSDRRFCAKHADVLARLSEGVDGENMVRALLWEC